jgi:hypothetical protein
MAEGPGPKSGEDASPDWNARAIARRHEAAAGKPLSPVMKAAATACELAHGPAARGQPTRG